MLRLLACKNREVPGSAKPALGTCSVRHPPPFTSALRFVSVGSSCIRYRLSASGLAVQRQRRRRRRRPGYNGTTFAVRAQDDSHGPRRLRGGSNRVKRER